MYLVQSSKIDREGHESWHYNFMVFRRKPQDLDYSIKEDFVYLKRHDNTLFRF